MHTSDPSEAAGRKEGGGIDVLHAVIVSPFDYMSSRGRGIMRAVGYR